MVKSMTAYGSGECTIGAKRFIAEMRSVNHRYRDVQVRMPRPLQPLEETLRSIVVSVVRRGRIEVSIQVEGTGDAGPAAVDLNLPMVKAYLDIYRRLGEEFGLEQRVSVDTLVQMRDVVVAKPEVPDLESLRPGLEEALGLAIRSFDAMRVKEGTAIETELSERLGLLEGYIDSLAARAPEVVEAYRLRLRENIRRMVQDGPLDEGRLAQEVAHFADRSDVTEEIVRLRSHVRQFRAFLEMEEALGRRLEFLIQEMNREVNTLGSKASDAEISKIVVEAKAELEKLREQVQNVE